MKVKELLESKENWIKGHCALTKNNELTSSNSADAAKWCLIGAIIRCYGVVGFAEFITEIKQHILPFSSVSLWNDTPNRTFEEVKELVNRLDI